MTEWLADSTSKMSVGKPSPFISRKVSEHHGSGKLPYNTNLRYSQGHSGQSSGQSGEGASGLLDHWFL